VALKIRRKWEGSSRAAAGKQRRGGSMQRTASSKRTVAKGAGDNSDVVRTDRRVSPFGHQRSTAAHGRRTSSLEI